MRVLLLSYNYDPEPSGIAPLSTAVALGLKRLGHDVEVVAAHPHYPVPEWGTSRLPYRERRGGIRISRLPLWVGRETAGQRLRQELSFTAALGALLPAFDHGDVVIVASPSFPALIPAMISARLHQTPWVMWVHDLLPDGAAVTDVLREGPLLKAARWLERRAYASAAQVVVISDGVRENIIEKGVDPGKVHRIYNPAPRPIQPFNRPAPEDPQRLFWMGNIGRSQGLARVVATLRTSEVLEELGVRLAVAGDGVEAPMVRREVGAAPIDLLGVLHGADVDDELAQARVGLIAQRSELAEFNLPSRMMHFFVRGVPVIAAVNARSETARLVESSGGGWTVDSERLEELPGLLREILADRDEIERRALAAYRYAGEHFAQDRVSRAFEKVILSAARV